MPRSTTLLLLLIQSLFASGAQLDLAVIRFPEVKTPAELDAALAGADLAAVTDAERTVTKIHTLKSGSVVFAQTFDAAPAFKTSTRLENSKAEVEGSISGDRLAVKITISEGVDVGLHNFSSRVYAGSAKLVPGVSKVLSMRIVSSKSQRLTKSFAELSEKTSTCALIARVR